MGRSGESLILLGSMNHRRRPHHLTMNEEIRDLSSIPMRFFSMETRSVATLFSCKRLKIEKYRDHPKYFIIIVS